MNGNKVEEGAVQSSKPDRQSANTSEELPLKCMHFGRSAVLRIVQKKLTATQKKIATEIGKSKRTIKTFTIHL